MRAARLAVEAPPATALRVCSRTVMDTTDPDITFDASGASNWWTGFQALRAAAPDAAEQRQELEAALTSIREAGRGRPFDCVLGLSGGVDSSYLAYLTRQWSLRPLVVHFDNGWNDERAVRNIELIVRKLGLRLQTFVMNWPEFRDLQRSYFKASVLDLEVPTDHLIFGALYRIAREHRVRYILSGSNTATEWVLPRAWYYSKFDFANLRAIHRRYGERPMRHLPKLGAWQGAYYQWVGGIRDIRMLDLVPYRKLEAMRVLEAEFGWQYYGGKHYESVFTRFYQGCLLPEKFGIDKRKAHLSNLICNEEMTRECALAELSKPTYDPDQQRADRRYVAKKLGWSEQEFEDILALPPRRHEDFGTDARQRWMVERLGLLRLVALKARKAAGRS